MTRKKLSIILLCLALVFAWAFTQDTPCLAAEQTYQISATQLTQLETNNSKLQDINKEQQWQLSELQRQVVILKSELDKSKQALTAAQQSLKKTQEYTEKLDNQIKRLAPNRIAPTIGYGTKAGFMAGIKYRVNEYYEVTAMGNSKSLVVGVAYNW